ncbi:MAG: SAM hydroxide adenosyltransferase, partial [Promethearchaeota archaeon]
MDSFGNITTNIPIQNGYVKKSNIKLKDNQIIEIHYNDNVKKGRLVPNFSSVNKGELLFLVGST